MNEGRLRLVNAQCRRRRKLTLISNSQAREKLDTYQWGMGRHQFRLEMQTKRESIPLKKSFVELKCYSKCLEDRKKAHMYGETPIYMYDDVKGDIDKAIKENHPKIRRMKKTKQLLTDGLVEGRLIQQDRVLGRLDHILDEWQTMSCPQSSLDLDSSQRLVLPPITSSTPHFDTSNTRSDTKVLGFANAKTALPMIGGKSHNEVKEEGIKSGNSTEKKRRTGRVLISRSELLLLRDGSGLNL